MSTPERRLNPTSLLEFCATVLSAGGASKDDAACVAAHLVDANLKGHDSHGAGLLPAYLRHMERGQVNLEASDQVLADTSVILRIDADGGWGAPAGQRLVERASAKAREHGLAAATLGHVHHLGRLGAYAEQAAAAGLVSIHFVNVTDHAPLVAPYRGTDARFGTNPVCIGYPATATRPAFLLDMATSQIALGKVRIAANRGVALPSGSLIDARGMPTTDPSGMAGFELEGALTPLGKHKGYGLAFACELLAGVLGGGGTIQPGTPRRGGISNGLFSIFIDPAAFGEPDWMQAETDAMARYALASPPMDWDSPVLYPGDPERAIAGKRAKEGIPMDEVTIGQLNTVAEALGVAERL
ncbi:malate/lactate/ureidoglycolate dehydrogenase [uncultured Maricaulis sp.]|uniref:malate/lactate/ureidoglycolate dehydrogenase n=1 Tax=uncultured Maricaulis sp. TaxID=174710 RepID=UPI0025FFB5EB|nr:malate/lactate/ureidoglycolate dehydrogenase [uncultured Maricaulis sp.]